MPIAYELASDTYYGLGVVTADTLIPFRSVLVHHRIKFTDLDQSEIVNSIQVRPEQKDARGRLVPSRFDTVLVRGKSQGSGIRCHGSGCDACLQGRPGVARPSDTSMKNIGREECRESRRKHVDRSDGSGREYWRIGRTHQITCCLEISVLITGLDMIG